MEVSLWLLSSYDCSMSMQRNRGEPCIASKAALVMTVQITISVYHLLVITYYSSSIWHTHTYGQNQRYTLGSQLASHTIVPSTDNDNKHLYVLRFSTRHKYTPYSVEQAPTPSFIQRWGPWASAHHYIAS